MSSYAYLYVDNNEIFNWRNDLDHSMMSLFSKGDIVEASGSEAIEIVKSRGLNSYDGYEDDGDNFSIMLFSRNAKELKDRLKILGYSEETFRTFLQEVGSCETSSLQPTDIQLNEYRASRAQEAQSLIDTYIAERELTEDNTKKLLEFLEYDSGFALYYNLKGVDDTANITLDISEFAYEGWYDDSMLEINQVTENIQRSSSSPIILTEGVFDRKVLKESIELLYPHLANYIKFLDTDFKTEGGAGALVKTLKSFAAAGISNRIIAVFDNDTAAYDALSGLRNFSLPKNYRVMHYPDIELGTDYPTLGPQGNVEMNVNKLAGAIELYLGRDALTNEEGGYRPVQWTGYVSKLSKYQGELLNKSKIQDKFLDKLKIAKRDSSKISGQDWSGIRAIIDAIVDNLSTL
jgi:hypothetical protein